MAEDFKGVPYRDDGTTPNYTTPDWSTVDPSSLSFTRQPAAVQKPEPTGSETYKSIGQQQGVVNDQEQQADQQSQNRNPDFYNNQKIINLNSNRYRGLGKRRRLRNDLRALGQDAVVWNGANMQMASNFSGGQQFNRRNAMDMIRNGRQNAGMYSDNNFKAGTIEADANRRVYEYFSEHQNASRANWDHGNWQKPTETPISQSFQNMLQQYQGGYTPGAMTAYAQQLQPTWKQQTAVTTQPVAQQQNATQNTQPAAATNSTTQAQRATRNNSAKTTQQPRTNALFNWKYGDLSNWQNLIGVNNDGKFGQETMAKFNDLFGNGWKQVYTKDGSAIKSADGTTYFNNGRYYNSDGSKGTWRKDGTQTLDITPKNFTVNSNIANSIMKPLIEGSYRYNSIPNDRWANIYYPYRRKFAEEYARKFGQDSVNSEEFENSLKRNYDSFIKSYGGVKKGTNIYFHKYK